MRASLSERSHPYHRRGTGEGAGPVSSSPCVRRNRCATASSLSERIPSRLAKPRHHVAYDALRFQAHASCRTQRSGLTRNPPCKSASFAHFHARAVARRRGSGCDEHAHGLRFARDGRRCHRDDIAGCRDRHVAPRATIEGMAELPWLAEVVAEPRTDCVRGLPWHAVRASLHWQCAYSHSSRGYRPARRRLFGDGLHKHTPALLECADDIWKVSRHDVPARQCGSVAPFLL